MPEADNSSTDVNAAMKTLSISEPFGRDRCYALQRGNYDVNQKTTGLTEEKEAPP